MARTHRYGFDRFGEGAPRRHGRFESEDTPLWEEDLDDADGDDDRDDLWDDSDDDDWDDGDSSYEEE